MTWLPVFVEQGRRSKDNLPLVFEVQINDVNRENEVNYIVSSPLSLHHHGYYFTLIRNTLRSEYFIMFCLYVFSTLFFLTPIYHWTYVVERGSGSLDNERRELVLLMMIVDTRLPTFTSESKTVFRPHSTREVIWIIISSPVVSLVPVPDFWSLRVFLKLSVSTSPSVGC